MPVHDNLQASFPPEVLPDFQKWQALLQKWNARINLVSKGAMDDFWGRHALDSWQLWDFVPDSAQNFIDLGSGGGFPGIAIAIGCKHRNDQSSVLLVESAGKKASFLKTVIRELNLPAKVHAGRAEDLSGTNAPASVDIITARAFAPLPRLLSYAQPFWGEGTTALLLKGQNANEELTEAAKAWDYDVELTPSQSDATGFVLKLSNLKARPT